MIDFEWKPKPISAEELETIVRELASERPDFVYVMGDPLMGCQYTHKDGKPGCIIGAALAAAGRAVPYRHDANTATDVRDLAETHGLITGDYMWLWTVQKQQDDDYTWQAAVRIADELREAELND